MPPRKGKKKTAPSRPEGPSAPDELAQTAVTKSPFRPMASLNTDPRSDKGAPHPMEESTSGKTTPFEQEKTVPFDTAPEPTAIVPESTAPKGAPRPPDKTAPRSPGQPKPVGAGAKNLNRTGLTQELDPKPDPDAQKPMAPEFTQPLHRRSPLPAPGGAAPTAAAVPPAVQDQLEKMAELLCATFDRVGELQSMLNSETQQRQQTLAETQSVQRDYQQLVERAIAERDGLAQELSELRAQYQEDLERQRQAYANLQHDVEKERRDYDRRVQSAGNEEQVLKRRVAEVEEQLREALDSRDRIAQRVRQVEANLDNTVLPLREELEQVKAREVQLRNELAAAHRDIAALKLLTGPPSHS